MRKHVAILTNTKKQPFIEKILDGEKPIESRWYRKVAKPLKRNTNGDVILNIDSEEIIRLKQSGGKILGEVTVKEVKLFSSDKYDLVAIMKKYQKELCITDEDIKNNSDAKYGILVFLKNQKRIKPENFAHKGRDAWIIEED